MVQWQMQWDFNDTIVWYCGSNDTIVFLMIVLGSCSNYSNISISVTKHRNVTGRAL